MTFFAYVYVCMYNVMTWEPALGYMNLHHYDIQHLIHTIHSVAEI